MKTPIGTVMSARLAPWPPVTCVAGLGGVRRAAVGFNRKRTAVGRLTVETPAAPDGQEV